MRFPHFILLLVQGRMSRVFIFAVLSLTSAALAEVAGPASTLGGVVTMPKACEELQEVKRAYNLTPASAFYNTVKGCLTSTKERENFTITAHVILDVYEAIIDRKCSFKNAADTEDKLAKCVTGTGGLPAFNKTEAESHFSMNGIVDLVFDAQHCSKAGKIWDCVNGVYSEHKITRDLKECKDGMFDGFEVTSNLCDSTKLTEVNRGPTYLPYYSLMMGTTFILFKLEHFSVY